MRKAKAQVLIDHGLCYCHWKPWASTRLEGFDEDLQFKFQLVADAAGSQWYRVYPCELRSLRHNGRATYYECIGPINFDRFFRVTWSAPLPDTVAERYQLEFDGVPLHFAALPRIGVKNG